ncbi:MAG: RNA 2',3'-cyclic phosphodiesterase [Chloroflexi bacterium]|nr:RNA 2',3'-cyclic phosphodiesterase [Chloroflexota bacterium]
MTEQKTLRLFVAAELPEEARHALGVAIDKLKRKNVDGLRWVATEGIHLTLKFLGNVEASQVRDLQAALESAASGLSRFTLRLANGGVFPNANNPRVVWVGLDGDIASLTSLQRRVERALTDIGFTTEERAFQPHLTLARVRDRLTSVERTQLMETLATLWEVEPPEFEVRSMSLMQSTLKSTGAEYTRLGEARLVG